MTSWLLKRAFPARERCPRSAQPEARAVAPQGPRKRGARSAAVNPRGQRGGYQYASAHRMGLLISLTQTAVGSFRVVVLSPMLDQDSNFFEAVKDLAVEKFITQFLVEGYAVAVFPGTAGLDVQRVGPDFGQPVPDNLGRHLRPVVGPDGQTDDVLGQRVLVTAQDRCIPLHRTRLPNQLARPALGHLELPLAPPPPAGAVQGSEVSRGNLMEHGLVQRQVGH